MKQRTIALLLTLLYACAFTPSPEMQARWDRTAKANEAKMTEVRTSKVPPDYKFKIEAAMDETLKDPESKIVEYVDQPLGSIVCGKMNAKNSYGGYVGKKPFLAYFNSQGALWGLETGLDDEAIAIFKWCSTPSCEYYPEKVFFRQCRF